MSREYERQHIVSKRYLNRFAKKTKQDKYVIVTGIRTNGRTKYVEQSTDNVGWIKNYYDVEESENNNGNTKYWENFFAQTVDSECGDPLEKIITSVQNQQKNYKLDDDDKQILSKIIVSQIFRIPENYDYYVKKINLRVVNRMIEKYKYVVPDIKILLDSITAMQKKELYYKTIFDDIFKLFWTVLYMRNWVIYINNSRPYCPFETSDNPVLVYNEKDCSQIGVFVNGLINEETALFFPITPSLAVGNYGQSIEFNSGVEYMDNKDKIMCYNSLITRQAYKHSFFPEPSGDKYLM